MTERVSPPAVCVLGMHRSGTSLTARVLNLLGLDLGPPEHLAGSWSVGDGGFAGENARLVSLNDRLLARLGGSWDRPPTLPAGWEERPDLADLRAHAAAVLAEEFAARSLWGWKDPRNSLTLPLWLALVPGLRCVLCVRHPLAVALSLRARDGFPPARSLRLWWTYNRVALRVLAQPAGQGWEGADAPAATMAGRGEWWIDVHYEDYFERPEALLARLAGFLGLAAAERGAALRRARAAIDPRLRHHAADGWPGSARLPAPVARLYGRLREAAGAR